MAAQQLARASPELRKAPLSPRYRRNYTTPRGTTTHDPQEAVRFEGEWFRVVCSTRGITRAPQSVGQLRFGDEADRVYGCLLSPKSSS